jgi:hypothetical protein
MLDILCLEESILIQVSKPALSLSRLVAQYQRISELMCFALYQLLDAPTKSGFMPELLASHCLVIASTVERLRHIYTW